MNTKQSKYLFSVFVWLLWKLIRLQRANDMLPKTIDELCVGISSKIRRKKMRNQSAEQMVICKILTSRGQRTLDKDQPKLKTRFMEQTNSLVTRLASQSPNANAFEKESS